jgi:MFS family permease
MAAGRIAIWWAEELAIKLWPYAVDRGGRGYDLKSIIDGAIAMNLSMANSLLSAGNRVPLSPVLAVIRGRRKMTMFGMVSLALTMLLGFAWAVLAQNYVSQMAPRIRYCSSGAHRSSTVGVFEGQNAEQDKPFRTCVADESQRRCGTAVLEDEQSSASTTNNLTNPSSPHN